MSKQIDFEKLRADAHRMAYVADQVRALEHKGSEADVYLTEAAQVFRYCAEVIAALEKDAERYQMMRNNVEALDSRDICIFDRDGWEIYGLLQGDELDREIDTAMEASNAKAD